MCFTWVFFDVDKYWWGRYYCAILLYPMEGKVQQDQIASKVTQLLANEGRNQTHAR